MAIKQIIHAPASCGGELVKTFTPENIPYLECALCQHKILDWVRWEEKYKSMWQDEAAWDRTADAVVVLLGYFCSVYEKAYNIPYQLSLNPNGLFRGPEATFIRRLLSAFSSNTRQVRHYIDWVFAYKVVEKKKKITSLSFLTVPNTIQLFRFQQEKANQISRNTKLPAPMLKWISLNAPTVLQKAQLDDFGDLALLLEHYKGGNLNNDEDMVKLIQQLYHKKIVDRDGNIRNYQGV